LSIVSEAPSHPADSSRRAAVRERFRAWRDRYLRIGSYPRGLLVGLLKSRVAPLLGQFLTLALFVCAALPDAGFKINKYVFIAGLAVLFVLTELFRTLVVGTGLDAYRTAARSIGYIISDFAGKLSGVNAAADEVIRNPADAVGIMLRQAKGFAEESLKIPEGELVTATLLYPEHDSSGKPSGLREKEYDDLQPWRSRRVFPLTLSALSTVWKGGIAAALPHTQSEQYFQKNPPPFRSAAYFPIFVGTSPIEDQNGQDQDQDQIRVYAVLAVESSEPYRFDARTVIKLEPFVTPIAQLIGLALTLDGRRDGTPAGSFKDA
jgi:hypothetical protein